MTTKLGNEARMSENVAKARNWLWKDVSGVRSGCNLVRARPKPKGTSHY